MSMKAESAPTAGAQARRRPSRAQRTARPNRQKKPDFFQGTSLELLLPTILKWVLFLILFVVLIGRMAGDKPSRTTFDAMTKAVTAAADLSNTDQADNQMVRRLYGLTPSDYEGVLLYAPKTNMGAEELFLVHLKDGSQEKQVTDAVEKRIETQKNSFKGYGAEQTAMLEKSISLTRGGYVLYYCGNNPQSVKAAFESAL